MLAGWVYLSALSAPELIYRGLYCLLVIPLLVELVIARHPIAAIGVALSDGAVMVLARLAGGAPVFPVDLAVYLSLPLLCGFMGGRLYTSIAAEYTERRRLDDDALTDRATMQARNDMLLGACGSVAESLHRAWFQLEQIGDQVDRDRRLHWTESRRLLAAQSRGRGAYLVDALNAYAADQRSRTARVADQLHLSIGKDDGLILLTAAQSADLFDRLDALGLGGGRQEVRVEDANRLTGAATLQIGDVQISIAPTTSRLGFGAVGFAIGSAVVLAEANPSTPSVPSWLVLTIAAGFLAASAYVRRAVARPGGRLSVCVLLAVTPAVVMFFGTFLPGTRWLLPDGSMIYPGMGSTTAAGLLALGAMWPLLPRWQRWAASVAVIVLPALSVWAHPGGRVTLDYVFGLLWTLSWMLIAQAVGSGLHESGRQFTSEVEDWRHDQLEGRYRAAVAAELAGYRDAIHEVEATLQLAPGDDPHAHVAAEHLDEAKQTMADFEATVLR